MDSANCKSSSIVAVVRHSSLRKSLEFCILMMRCLTNKVGGCHRQLDIYVLQESISFSIAAFARKSGLTLGETDVGPQFVIKY